MSRFCPITNSKVVYLVCQECDYKNLCTKSPEKVKELLKKEKRITENDQNNNSRL